MFINSSDVASPRWFLQLPPSGVSDAGADGEWVAVGQIGNHEYPPHRNQQISVLMLALPVADADRFVQERLKDATLQNVGMNSQELPQVERQWIARVNELPIRFIPRRW